MKIGEKMNLIVPAWVSTRNYQSESSSKSIVANDLDHEIVTFDDASADLWALMVSDSDTEGYFNIEAIAAKYQAPVDEVHSFVDVLIGANLISQNRSSEVFNDYKSNTKPKIMSSQKYAAGGYYESAPGGTNLEVENDVLEFAAKNSYLYAATWEITYRCNESCVHCFNPGASHVAGDKPKRKTDELTTEEAFEFLLDLRQSGVFRLLITGGEVFLRKDIYEILTFAKKLRFSVTLFTNGVLLNQEKVNQIRDLYITRVEMSIYSTKPEVHDAITKLKHSYRDTINAAKMLNDAGLNVALKMITMKDTINDAADFTLMCDELGVEGQVDFNMSAGVDGSNFPTNNLIPSAVDLIIKSLDSRTSLFVGEIGAPRKFDPKKLNGQRVCGAGVTLLSISPEGHIYPCNSLPIQVGNLREERVSAVWGASSVGKSESETPSFDRLSQWQSIKRGDYDVCGTFDRCGWCQKCPGMAFLETGSELAPSTVNCRNSAARMIAYDLLKEYGTEANLHIHEGDLALKYPDERALWETKTIQNSISLDKVKKILKERTKAKALQ